MVIKSFFCIVLAVATFVVCGQTRKNTPAKMVKKNTTATVSGQPGMPSSGRFDPTTPLLTTVQIKETMNFVRKRLLERKLSDEIKAPKDDKSESFISQTEFSQILTRYKRMMNNFELAEVSRVNPAWYAKYYAELEKFRPIVLKMAQALQRMSAVQYEDAVHAFREQQKQCLAYLKTPQPKLTSSQLSALRKKNTRERSIRRNKLQRQLMEQRRKQQLQRGAVKK